MIRLLLSIALLFFVIAACGGSDDTPSAGESTDTLDTVAPEATTALATPTPAATPTPSISMAAPTAVLATPRPTTTPAPSTPMPTATPPPATPIPTPTAVPGDVMAQRLFEDWTLDSLDQVINMILKLVEAKVGTKLTDIEIPKLIEDSLEIAPGLPVLVGVGTYRLEVVARATPEVELPGVGALTLIVELPIQVEVDVEDESVSWEFDTDNLSVTVEGEDLAIEVPSSLTPEEAVELARSWTDANLGVLAEQFAQGILAQQPLASTIVGGDLTAEVTDKVTLTFGSPSAVDGTTLRVPVTLTLEEGYEVPVLGDVMVVVSQTLGVDINVQDREVTGWEVLVDLTLALGGDSAIEVPVQQVPDDVPSLLAPEETAELARSWADAKLSELAEQFAQGILAQQPLAATIVGGDLTAEVMDKVALAFGSPSRVDDTSFRVPVTLTLQEEYEAPLLGNVNVMVSQTLGVDIDILAGEVTGWEVLVALSIAVG